MPKTFVLKFQKDPSTKSRPVLPILIYRSSFLLGLRLVFFFYCFLTVCLNLCVMSIISVRIYSVMSIISVRIYSVMSIISVRIYMLVYHIELQNLLHNSVYNYLTHWATRALQLPNSLSHPGPLIHWNVVLSVSHCYIYRVM
jgi:hypothetical protein